MTKFIVDIFSILADIVTLVLVTEFAQRLIHSVDGGKDRNFDRDGANDLAVPVREKHLAKIAVLDKPVTVVLRAC